MKLSLKVVPGASKEDVQWLDASCTILKVRVRAAPEKGKANKAVEKLLAAHLGLPGSAVRIVSGATGRQKLVEIDGIQEDELRSRVRIPTP